MRNYCTYLDRHYLARALALIESLERQEHEDFRIHVVCLDEMTRILLGRLANPHVVPVPLFELERNDQVLLATREGRTTVEYYFTLTPTILLRLLDRVPEGECLVYLDADLYFYGSPDPVFREFEGHSVLIHEHRFSPQLAWLEAESGRFNVGMVGFRRDAQGLETLTWWRERCLEWCFNRTEDGKMGDQMYLNDWPVRFKGVRILQHPGCAVAPWNHSMLTFSRGPGGTPSVQGLPLVFYHFQALIPVTSEAYLPAKHANYPLPMASLLMCYLPYIACLERWNDWLRNLMPLDFGYWPAQTIYENNALIVRGSIREAILQAGPIPLDGDWSLVPGGQVLMDPAFKPPAL